MVDPDFDRSNLTLAKDSETNLRADISSWEREHETFNKCDVSLLLDLYTSVSPESMMFAKACPEHALCMALPVGSRSIAFRNILIATHSTDETFQVQPTVPHQASPATYAPRSAEQRMPRDTPLTPASSTRRVRSSNQSLYDKLMRSRQRTADSASVSSTVSSITIPSTIPSRKPSSGVDRHLVR